MSGLRVLNRLGTFQWGFKGATDRAVASPALAGNVVYLPSSDHNVYAVDLDTREARWVFETENWVWATPLVVEDVVYIASMDHTLYAVDDESGREAWRFERSKSALPATPAYAEGVLYLGSLDGHIYAVGAQDGELAWERKVDGGVWAMPIIEQGTLYFGTLNGNIYALNAADGSELWVQSVEGEVRGSAAYVHANGMVYFGCEDGQLYAFDAHNGSRGVSPLGQQLEKVSIHTSPVFDGRHLYVVATDGQVFALDPVENKPVWTPTNPVDTDN
jgi:outer membrane protein assembly factor BamB